MSPPPPSIQHSATTVERGLTAPSLSWMLLFFALPAVNLFLMAFHPADATGGVGQGWTLEAWLVYRQPGYVEAIVRTVWITTVVVAGCLLVALPVAWRITQSGPRARSWWLLLVLLPFWTSFLMRVYAWRVLLQSSGPLSTLLQSLGVVEPGTLLLYHPAAVIVVMIYTYLPLAILPLYAAMEKFDMQLLEAAQDLGATRWQALRHVLFPGVRKGIVAAALLVGIPSLGSYVVPEMIGGLDAEMLGSKIGQRLFADRNLPQAAALALGLALLAMPAVIAAVRKRPEDEAP